MKSDAERASALRPARVGNATVAVGVAVLLFAGCGGAPRLREASPAVARRLLMQRLEAKGLDVRWVACVRVGRTYRRVPITRCNVDFGDPHVEAYCLLLDHGGLVTNHDDPAIPCRHDDAGWDRTTIVTS
jgi:hypothetical protein